MSHDVPASCRPGGQNSRPPWRRPAMIPPLLTPGRARWLLYLLSRSAIRVRCRCHPRVQPRRRVADRVPVAWAEGWPDAEAVETVDLHGTDGVTRVKMNLAFRDQAGRDHMTKTDGQEDSWDKMEDYLRSLVDPSGTVSGT